MSLQARYIYETFRFFVERYIQGLMLAEDTPFHSLRVILFVVTGSEQHTCPKVYSEVEETSKRSGGRHQIVCTMQWQLPMKWLTALICKLVSRWLVCQLATCKIDMIGFSIDGIRFLMIKHCLNLSKMSMCYFDTPQDLQELYCTLNLTTN